MENKYNIYNTISREIIGAAIEVHKELGPDCWNACMKHVSSENFKEKAWK